MPHPGQGSLFPKSQAAQRFHGNVGGIVQENGALSCTNLIQRPRQEFLFNLALQLGINEKHKSLHGSSMDRKAARKPPGFSSNKMQLCLAIE
jgi:hypothetical protein